MARVAASSGSGLPCHPSRSSTSGMPLPLTVRATTATGRPERRRARRSALTTSLMSWPSTATARQPKASNRFRYAWTSCSSIVACD